MKRTLLEFNPLAKLGDSQVSSTHQQKAGHPQQVPRFFALTVLDALSMSRKSLAVFSTELHTVRMAQAERAKSQI